MKEYLASRLVEVTRNLATIQLMPVKNREDLKRWTKEVWEECKLLGLPSTERQAIRLGSYAKDEHRDKAEIESAADELSQRFDDEIESLKLFYVPSDKITFYNKTDLFGEEFKTNFPTANVEISEAANCFAFDRFTACAFHLMRSLEVVLKVLFRTLGLPPLTSAGAQNWNGVLREIKDKLEADKTIPDHAFYESAYAFLAAAKNPMRNATMHVDAVYDENSVSHLYNAVGAFMRHIATKLKENP